VEEVTATRPSGGGLRYWLGLPVALSTLFFGLTAAPYFGWMAWRLHSRRLAVEATAYLALTAAWIALVAQNQPHGATAVAAGLIIIGLSLVSCGRALFLWWRGVYASRLPARSASHTHWVDPTTVSGWASAPVATSWPAGLGLGEATTYCDGSDRHQLSQTMGQAALMFLVGAVLVVLGALLGEAGVRTIVYGSGLVLAAVTVVLFARWVDGPTLHYRVWGRHHALSLTDVTTVSAPKRSRRNQSVSLTTPMRAKPLRLGVRRGLTSPIAYGHLQRWLTSPHVQWSPQAVTLFNRATRPTRVRPWTRLAASLLPVLIGAGILTVVVVEQRSSFSIPGAPGYSTFAGADGDALVVGRPWGTPCQPIRFVLDPTAPTWVYPQVAAAVGEARGEGIDVTLETREFSWSPTRLYYRAGQSPATTAQVTIFATDRASPTLSNGQPEHIGLGWDAENGRLTRLQGQLWLPSVTGPRLVRRSIRQLIAMTQGIISTSNPNSGIPDGNHASSFTSEDIAAMLRMSGCQG
jgi:hypothetical protein